MRAAAACLLLAVHSSMLMRLMLGATSEAGVVGDEVGRDEVLPCTCGEDSRPEGECEPCWLGVALLAMVTEVPLIRREGECARPVGWREHVMMGARGVCVPDTTVRDSSSVGV